MIILMEAILFLQNSDSMIILLNYEVLSKPMKILIQEQFVV